MTQFLPSLRKKLPLGGVLSLLLLSAKVTLAQGPVDAYSFTPSTGTFTPLAAATPVTDILLDDAISATITLPFTFVYDDAPYTTVRASSNGFLSFNANSPSTFTNNLSTGDAGLRPLVAPFWDDLDGRSSGAAAGYQVTGTAPNRVFTFEWRNWGRYESPANPTPVLSYQVKLYETTNVVQFVYRQDTGTSAVLSASIGLSGVGSGAGTFLSLSNAGAAPTTSSTTETSTISTRPATGQVYTFTPPVLTGCPAPRSVAVGTITGTTASITFRGNAAATGYTAIVTPLNGTPLAPITSTASPINLTGLVPYTSYSVTVVTNCAGSTTSAASAPVSFVTTGPYCTANLGGVCGGNDITSVTVTNTTLDANGLTCNTPTPGSVYTAYPAVLPYTGTLFRGTAYPITVNTTGNSIISVWIDLNHDLNYSSNEWVQVATSSTAGTPATATFNIPSTGYTGPTGMRVRSRISGNANGAADACLNFGSGEAKDFVINIAPEPPCPAPTALSANTITTTTAVLNYTAPGPGTYSIIYGPQGFNPGTAGTTLTGTTSLTPVTSLQPGTTYQFYVQRDCGAAGLSVNAGPVSFTTAIVNDDPCGATTLPLGLSGCSPFATTSIGATATTPNGYTNPSGCGIGATPRDVWFRFTTAASGAGSTSVRISVTGNPASVVQALSAATCTGPFTPIQCSGTAANTPAPALDLTGLTANTTYYVRVYGFTPGAALGNFTICATPLPTCPNPTAITPVVTTKNSALLTWTTGTGGVPSGSTYTIIYGQPGFNPNNSGTVIPGINANSYNLTGLNPDTPYEYYLRLVCGGLNGNSNQIGAIPFRTLIESPTNDEPCGAVALTSGAVPASGSTIGATTSTQPGIGSSFCAPTTTPRDVWYAITTPAATVGTDSLILTINGTASGMVRVYSAPSCSAGPFTLVGCAAASASNTGFVAPAAFGQLTPGTTYYIAVSGYGASDALGTFNIGAQIIYVGPTCNPITALAIGNLTTTSAELTFTPGANNTSYTVTYSVAGGSATTVTATASPYTLTGLQPGANYNVTVTPVCANGGSAAGTNASFATVTPICDPATNLTVTNIASTSALVGLTAGNGNTSFIITITTVGSPAIVDTVTTVPATITGLLPNTSYSITVTPLCSGGGSTGDLTATFSTPLPTCDPITAPVVANIGITTAELSFTPGAGNTSYTVVLTAPGLPTVSNTYTTLPVSLSGLVGNTSYTATITPMCAGGGTATDVSTTFTTLVAPCGPATALAVTGITSSSASVAFTPGTNNGSFEVSATPTAGGPTVNATTTASPAALTGLLPNTAYTVTVRSICLGGLPVTATTTFTTPLSTRASLGRGLLAVYPNPAHRSVTLSIPAVTSTPSAHIQILNGLGQVVSQRAVALSADGTKTTMDISGLAAGVYMVQVRAGAHAAIVRLIVE